MSDFTEKSKTRCFPGAQIRHHSPPCWQRRGSRAVRTPSRYISAGWLGLIISIIVILSTDKHCRLMPNEPLYQFYETVPDIGGEERTVREEGSPDIKDQHSLGGNLTQHRSCLSRLSSGQQSAQPSVLNFKWCDGHILQIDRAWCSSTQIWLEVEFFHYWLEHKGYPWKHGYNLWSTLHQKWLISRLSSVEQQAVV